MRIVTYGEGGFDTSKPNGNIVSVEDVPGETPPPESASIDIAALRSTVSKATTVTQLRGAMLAYLDAVAADQG